MYANGDDGVVVVLQEYVVVAIVLEVVEVVVAVVRMAGPPGSDTLVDPAGTVNVKVIILRVESSDAEGN
jgi:hypothetical protein